MPSQDGFALPPSDLNEFLFQNIEVQPASRFLSYDSAVSELSASIAVRPSNSSLQSDPETIAPGLIALLPARNTSTGVRIWA